MNQSVFYASVMLLAGLGIPVMAAINGGLGARLQNPSLASAILLLFGSLASLLILLLTEGIPRSIAADRVPGYFYLGGAFITFYIFSVTWIAPRFGVANAISFVLLGQLIAMTVIDQFGLFGMTQVELSTRRLAGLILMAGSVFLVLE